jgi:hypothetical protein
MAQPTSQIHFNFPTVGKLGEARSTVMKTQKTTIEKLSARESRIRRKMGITSPENARGLHNQLGAVANLTKKWRELQECKRLARDESDGEISEKNRKKIRSLELDYDCWLKRYQSGE